MADDEDDAEDRSRLELVVTKGAQLAGALGSAAAGSVVAPGLGTVVGVGVGWAVGEAIAATTIDVIRRFWGRGGERAAATSILIAEDGRAREQRGETPRDDGFFDARGELRPEEEELLEAILLTAANTYEERKLPYLANLFNGVKYDGSVRPPDALFLSRIADELTYRQLVGLAVVGRSEEPEEGPTDLRSFDVVDRDELRERLTLAKAMHDEGSTIPDSTFMRELDDLGVRSLVGVESTNLMIRSPADLAGGSTISSYPYSQAHLTESGELLWRLMRLEEIAPGDVEQWVAELGGSERGLKPAESQ